MIAFLRGILAHNSGGIIVVDVKGVGYKVRVPIGSMVGAIGEEITVHTHMAVREDAMDLYGFESPADRDLFIVLMSVSGIGAKTALAAVETLGSEGFSAAIMSEDMASLSSIPGVGKKSAQRMILELREKISQYTTTTGDTAIPTNKAGLQGPKEEAILALCALGYSEREATSALAGANGSAEEMIRTGLKALAK